MKKYFFRIKKKLKEHIAAEKAYIKKLLFPLKLFPLKLIIYFIYYPIKIVLKLILAILGLLWDTVSYPFRNLKNFIKSIFISAGIVYMVASLFVIVDYLSKEYGYIGKFTCSFGVINNLDEKVVRIVGGYSEGSGFLISKNEVMTNFHVIADEPSPKIIFPDGHFTTPTSIVGDNSADLAILKINEEHPDLVLEFLDPLILYDNEKLIAAGYPMGTEITGNATVVDGKYLDIRESKHYPVRYIHTDVDLVEGMSGGPLIERCGKVVGVNTMGLSGQSLFIASVDVLGKIPNLTDQNITKINVNPSLSPEEAVRAFYVYLKARRMEDGFNLLSKEYLQKTNFEEWTNRFTDIIDVEVYVSRPHENSSDTVFVKFTTKNWNDGEVDYHFYEGTWQTVLEDGVYKMNKSNIKEVDYPSWDWYYN